MILIVHHYGRDPASTLRHDSEVVDFVKAPPDPLGFHIGSQVVINSMNAPATSPMIPQNICFSMVPDSNADVSEASSADSTPRKLAMSD